MESFLRDEVDLSYVARVAVAPFENNSKEQFAPERIRGMAVTEILAQGLFDVVDKGLVDSAFREEAVDLSKGSMDAAVMKRLGQRLNVQAFLMGSIDQAGDVQRGPNTYPALAITLRLVDAHTGMIFWQASGSRTGDSISKRLFGLGSDDEFKVSLRLLRQLLATIASEKKVKLPTVAATSPVLIEPAKELEPTAGEPEAQDQNQPELSESNQGDQKEAPSHITDPLAAPPLGGEEGQMESLDQTDPNAQPELDGTTVPPAENESLPQEVDSAPDMDTPAEASPQPQAVTPAVDESSASSVEEMQPADQNWPNAEEEEMKPADQSAPPAPANDSAPSLQLDQAWPE